MQCYRKPRLRMNVAVFQMIQRWQPEMLDFIFDGVQTEKLVLVFCSFPHWRRLCRSSIWRETARLLFTSCLRDPRISFFPRLNQKSLWRSDSCRKQFWLYVLPAGHIASPQLWHHFPVFRSNSWSCVNLNVTDWLIPNCETPTSTMTLRSSQLHTGTGTRENFESSQIWSDQTGHVPAVILKIWHQWESGLSAECLSL